MSGPNNASFAVQAKRDFSIEMDGETRGVARRLADGLEAQQRLADDLERKLSVAKANEGTGHWWNKTWIRHDKTW